MNPALYQLNARVVLRERAEALGRPTTLDDLPDELLDRLAGLGFDWLYLLGVWRTGPAGRAVSLARDDWRAGYSVDLPGWTVADVAGSPFAVRAYRVQDDLGGDEALARLRGRLAARRLKLMLDFVPNHTAIDHPWAFDHPEYYVQATERHLAREPHNYLRIDTSLGPRIVAHGRDPYFSGWPDTLQLNYKHPALRVAMIDDLRSIADRSDGARCDMAMLLLPDVIWRTWGELSAPPEDDVTPIDRSFWLDAVPAVRAEHPAFTLLAEVYWDREWELQQEGFDFTYDKRLYDRLHGGTAADVRRHLWATEDFQRRSARFLENHDEPRAAAAFPPDRHRAAAVAAFFTHGLRFVHDGQIEGRRLRANNHLARRAAEPVDASIQTFYDQMLKLLGQTIAREGDWRLLECLPAWSGNPTCDAFLAYLWDHSATAERLLVAVNDGPTRAQCYVALPADEFRGRAWTLTDRLGPSVYERDGDDLAARGLYLDLPPWGYHAFDLRGDLQGERGA